MEPPGTAGAGIEPEDTVPLLLHILVGVAKDYHIHAGKVRRDLFFVVDHGKGHAVQGHGEVVGDVLGPLLVIVAPDDVERGVLPQLVHDTGLVDVAAVENGVGGFQMFHHLRPQQAMGVG